jgi:hypothetical protein
MIILTKIFFMNSYQNISIFLWPTFFFKKISITPFGIRYYLYNLRTDKFSIIAPEDMIQI